MIHSITRSVSSTRALLMAGAAAVLSVAALGFSTGAHARSDINFSVGVSTPGVVIGVSNAYPVYTAPVYGQPVYGYQPQPVYVQPAPVYVQPRPVYRPRPVYVQAPIMWRRPPCITAVVITTATMGTVTAAMDTATAVKPAPAYKKARRFEACGLFSCSKASGTELAPEHVVGLVRHADPHADLCRAAIAHRRQAADRAYALDVADVAEGAGQGGRVDPRALQRKVGCTVVDLDKLTHHQFGAVAVYPGARAAGQHDAVVGGVPQFDAAVARQPGVLPGGAAGGLAFVLQLADAARFEHRLVTGRHADVGRQCGLPGQVVGQGPGGRTAGHQDGSAGCQQEAAQVAGGRSRGSVCVQKISR